MYDIVIVGAGIAGLNMARLLKDKQLNICILEKTNRIGGLIHTKHTSFDNKKIKYESGGAVVYNYQKNMLDLIKLYDIKTHSMPVDNKTIVNRHYKDFWDGKSRLRPMDKRYVNKFFKLIIKVFKFMDKKGKAYCRKFTLEQIALKILSLDDVRFIEFCYGYAAEFRIANSIVARKNINNELFNTDNILVFNNGYSSLIKSIYNDIKDNIKLIKNCHVDKFINYKNHINIYTNKGNIQTKKIIFAIPREALINMCDSFNADEIKLFNMVKPFSLNRIFVKYDMKKSKNLWMKKLNFSTVNNPIRQIIPINKKHGFFQISYSDWYFADYWGNLNKANSLNILKQLLSQTFHNANIDNPTYYKQFYWKDACHFWKSNINEVLNYKKILNIRNNVYIIGESFSLNQGWAEGAIQTSIDVFKMLFN